ncbi:MAG TPA: hypothetical protein VLT47_09545 [Anaeromyxobacteraceae bacterium]|nr:hypothetical protein [Anaeromyxobacteraceae bacterium]
MSPIAIASRVEEFAYLSGAFEDEGHDSHDAAFRARLVMAIGRVEALSRLGSQDAFEAGIDWLSTPQFLGELEQVFSDPAFPELARAVQVSELRPQPLADAHAQEMLDDLLEYSERAARLPAGDVTEPQASYVHGLARLLVAVMALSLAAHGRERWSSWMVGMLWHEGRRGVLEMAATRGIGWAQVADGARTSRDERCSAQPFDQAASDDALKLLGLAN